MKANDFAKHSYYSFSLCQQMYTQTKIFNGTPEVTIQCFVSVCEMQGPGKLLGQ